MERYRFYNLTAAQCENCSAVRFLEADSEQVLGELQFVSCVDTNLHGVIVMSLLWLILISCLS